MEGRSDLCDKTGGPEDPGVYAFSYPIVLPLAVVLCFYFLYKLYCCQTNTLRVTTAVYVTVALCLELSHSWLYFVRQITRANTSIAFCAAMEFSGWMLIVGSYVCLQQVLLHRLKVVFATSFYEVKQSVIHWWNAFHALLLTVAMVVFTINSSVMKCKRKIEQNGVAVDIGMYPKFHKVCAANSKELYNISFFGVLFAGLCVLFGNAVLAWMYVNRIQTVLGSRHCGSTNEDRVIAVVKKASVVALASITTTCFALFGGVFSKILMHIDTLLNVYFLFCQFGFARPFYDATLAYCEPVVDWLLPEQSTDALLASSSDIEL